MSARLLALVAAVAGCDGATVTVVTVDARPSVHGATKLEVVLGNGTSKLTQSFDLHGHPFPATFSVETPGRSGALTLDARALDDTAAAVGVGSATATIDPGGESSASILLDPADFIVNTQYAGSQRTDFFLSTGGRQIAATADGLFTAVWSDDCGSLGRCDEWGRRFDATGAPVSSVIAAGTAQFNINRTDVFGTDAAVAVGADGTLVAVWTTQTQIVCSAIAPDGSIGTPAEVILSTGTVPDHPGIAALPSNRFAVAWQENAAGTGTPVIRARLVDKACAPQTNPNSNDVNAFTVSATASPAPDQPAIATIPDGSGTGVVWRAGPRLRGTFLDGTGKITTMEAPVLSAGATDEVWGPQMVGVTGGYALVYSLLTAADPLPTGGHLLRRIDNKGIQTAVEVIVATPTPDDFSVASVARRADGSLGIAWHGCAADGDGAGCGIWARVVPAGADAAGPPILVDTTTAGDQTDPAIAALPAGFAVVWTDASGTPPDMSMTGIRARVIYPAD